MSEKQVEREGSEDSVGRLLTLQKQWERKEKGYKGQIAKLQADISQQKPKSSPESSDSSQTESVQAAPEHLARDYERKCVDCGGDNPNFKGAPNVFCGAKGCDGKIPMGHVEPSDIKKLEDGKVDIPVKACFNCGSDKDAVVIL